MSIDALPAGFSVAPAQLTQAEELNTLVTAHHVASGGRERPALAAVVADLEHPEMTLARDTWTVRSADGVLVGYGIAYVDTPGRTFIDVYVEPSLDEDPAHAIGVWLTGAGVERALVDARERGLDRALVESGLIRGDERHGRALGALGLVPARTWWRMTAETSVLGAVRPQDPEGIAIVRVDGDDDAVMAQAHRLHQESFSEHYGHVARCLESFSTDMRNIAGYDPTAYWFATDTGTGEPVGLLVGADVHAEDGGGYIDTLGVLASHRGRGIAAALLRTSFEEYARRGRVRVSLDVDASNETGAVALYERVGMHALDVIETWERELAL